MATTRHSAGCVVLLAAATLAHAAAPVGASAPAQAASSAETPTPAHAPPVVTPTLAIRAVATDNAALTTSDLRKSDVIGDVDLGLVLREHGSHVTLTGDIGLDFIGYANHTEPNRVLPRGRVDLATILVDRALFFDGSIEASRTRSDPLGPQVDGANTANTVSNVSLRASPYFSREFSPTVSMLARSDTVVTRSKGDSAAGAIAPNGSTDQHDVVRIDRKPTPVGISLDVSHDETTYQDVSTPVLRADSARVTLSDALDTELLTGVIAGRDHVTYASTVINDNRYGLMTEWRPSGRTQLDASVEHRFFGIGFNAHFRDRLPLTIIDFTLQRAPSASPASFGLTGPDSDPATLLNSLLSTRIPGANERDDAVGALVASEGLPADFNQPLQIFSESAQLATRAVLNLVLNGVRNTVFATAYYAKATALGGAGSPLSAATFDSRQWGGSLGLYHRLTPDMSGAAEVSWSDIVALGARAGDSSREVVGTLSLTRRLGPMTSLSCGLRHFSSRVVLGSPSTVSQVSENQAFAGLRMQY